MPILGPFGFSGGWNTKASALTLPPNQMSDSQNVQVVYGDLMKRKGSAAINASAFASGAAVHGMADWQTAAGQRYLIVTAGAKIGQMADLGGTFTDITGAVTITSGADNQSTFASLNNILVRCGGTTPDAPVKWTGTGNAAALGGSPPSGNIVAMANNFMFISGVAATPSRVFWSNVSDPETWGAANYVDFRVSDGDKVTACVDMDQSLIIFKRRSVGQLGTLPPSSSASVTLGPLIQKNGNIGCPGPLCVDKLPDGTLIFLGTNAHVYTFDGTVFEDISDVPQPQANIQPTLDALPVGRLPYAVMKSYPSRNQVWLSVSTTGNTTNNAVLIYDTIIGAWVSKFTGIAANVLATTIDTRATPSHPIVILTGNYSGKVYEQDTGSTNPEDTNGAIDGYGTLSIQLSQDEKAFIPVSGVVLVEDSGSNNLEVNYGFDALTDVNKSAVVSMQGVGGLLDNLVLDVDVLAGPPTLRRIVKFGSTGRNSSMQIQFRNRLSGQDFTVHPFYLADEVLI